MAIEIINQYDPEGLRKVNANFGQIAEDIGDPETIARLSEVGATPWDSGNYEINEGVLDVALIGFTTAGNNTYSLRKGSYLIEGDYITIWVAITLSVKDPNMAGSLLITGAPKLPTDVIFSRNSVFRLENFTFRANYSNMSAYLASSGVIYLTMRGNGVPEAFANATDVASNFGVSFSIRYKFK